MGRYRRNAAAAALEHAEEQYAFYMDFDSEDSPAYAAAYEQFLAEYDIDDIYHTLYLEGISTVEGALEWVEHLVEC